MIISVGLQLRRGHPHVRACESNRAARASPQVASCRWPTRKGRPCPRRSVRWDMPGRIRYRVPETISELHGVCGDALPDVDIDREATLRRDLAHSFYCVVPDRTGL